MAVTVQTGNIVGWDGGPNTTHDESVTVSAGSGLAIFIIVGGGYRVDSTPGGGFWNLPTVDGNNATSVATIADGANNTTNIYRYLLGSTSGTFTVRFSVAAYAGGSYVCTIVPMSGVDQTTPTGTPVLYTTGTSASPQSNSCTVASGGVAIAGHGINATTQGLTAGAGQTNLRAAVVQGGNEYLHTYKADATAMGYSWTATSPQNHQVIVPVNPAAASDTTAPVLTAPTGTATGPTTATVGATTDEGNGTLYAVVTTSATQPSVAQIKAGETHTGAAAPWDGSVAVSSTGAKTIGATGLTSATTYYAHLVHADAAANDSNRVSSSSFTTSSVAGLTSSTLKNNTGTVRASEPFEAYVHNPSTGALVLKKTGLTSHATTAVVTFTDASLTAATAYRVVWRQTSTGAEGLETLTAT